MSNSEAESSLLHNWEITGLIFSDSSFSANIRYQTILEIL